MRNHYFKNVFGKISLTVLAAGTILLGTTETSSAQSHFKKFIKSEQAKTVSQKDNSNSRVANLLSLPGNTSNYVTDSMGGWILQSTSAYRYNNRGKLLSKINRNPAGQYTNRDSILYDALGSPLYEGIYYWGSNMWQKGLEYRHVNLYNGNNQITETMTQRWNSSLNNWESYRRETKSYNSAGNLISHGRSTWNGSGWSVDFFERYIFTNPTDSTPVAIVYDVYVNGTREEHRYNNIIWHNYAEYKPISFTEEINNGNIYFADWDTTGRANFVYDVNDGFVETFQTYNNGTWENEYRWTIVQDSHKNQISDVFETWTNNSWTLDDQTDNILTYNASNDITERIIRELDWNTGLMHDSRKIVYSNFTRISGMQQTIPQIQASLYPNPTTGPATIHAETTGNATITITDLTGRVVLTQQLNLTPASTNQLDFSGLANGTYLLKLQTAKGAYTTKVVKH